MTGKTLCINMPSVTAGTVQQEFIRSGLGANGIFEVTLNALQVDCGPMLKINLQIYHWCVNMLLI